MAKTISSRKGKDLNKKEIAKREEIEKRLMGNSDSLDNISEDLNDIQKIYYKWLVQELKHTEMISNIDIPLIEQASFCLWVIKQCMEEINERGILVEGVDRNGKNCLIDNPSLKTHKDYTAKYATLCNQLGLSPTARANIANKKVQIKEIAEDPLLKILRGDF